VASQVIAAQLVSKTDGSAVTSGTTTVYVTVDGGTQASSGTATHEGNGCWTYLPTQAETNGNHVVFTFVNTSAVSVSVNVYPVAYNPYSATDLGLSNLDATITSRMASYTQPTGFLATTFPSGTVASTTNITAGTITTVSTVTGLTASDVGAIKTKTDFLPSATAGTAGGLFIAGTNAATVITGSLTTTFTGNLTGSVGSVTTNGITTASFAAGTTLPRVTLADTVTTYTGNTPQTGDSFARIGAAGANLTALGDTRLANLDAAVSSRMSTYIQPSGFLAATFPTDVAGLGALASAHGAGSWATATGFSTHTAADVWSVGTRLLTAGTNIVLSKGVGVTGFNDLSASQVNAEVVDALSVDTYSEPSGAPSASNTVTNKLGYLYNVLRNRIDATASLKTFYKDDGTVHWTKVISDDNTTYTEQKGS